MTQSMQPHVQPPARTYGLCDAAGHAGELRRRLCHERGDVLLYVAALAEKVGSHHNAARASSHTAACSSSSASSSSSSSGA
jgi:hypothetical protein